MNTKQGENNLVPSGREEDIKKILKTIISAFRLSRARGLGHHAVKFPNSEIVKEETETKAIQIARHLDNKKMKWWKIEWIACVSLFFALKEDHNIVKEFKPFTGLDNSYFLGLARKAKDALVTDSPEIVTVVRDPVTIPAIPKTMAELRQILSKRDLEEYEGRPSEREAGAE